MPSALDLPWDTSNVRLVAKGATVSFIWVSIGLAAYFRCTGDLAFGGVVATAIVAFGF